MASAQAMCAAPAAFAGRASRDPRASAAKSLRSEFAGNGVAAAPAVRARSRRAAVQTQAILVPSTRHEVPDTKLRPVSSAAVDSSTALAQFQRMGGASRYDTEQRSSIVAIGLSIHTAPVEMREKLAVQADYWERAVKELCSYPHIDEAGILSTCNRMEVYVVALSWHRGVREVEDWMAKHSGIELDELRQHLFLLRDNDATAHLLRVSGGLDSVVLGEGQILSQVKNVFALGENVDNFGRHLSGLFKAAITAGKRVRSETKIASGAVSVSSAAAELVQMKLPAGNFDNCRVLIVGAGTMSRLLVKHLVSKNCTNMTIVNRTAPRAEELAADFPEADIKIALMDEFLSLSAEHDVIFTASSAVDPIITKADLVGMPAPSEAVGGVRRLVDIAVPRNVASDCSEDANTLCYNVDDLKEVVDANKEAREAAAAEAENLLAEELASFEAWRDSLETVPTIKRLRSKAEAIRSTELDKAMNKLGDGLTNKQKKAVEELSRGIVNKLLHGPMQALRSDGTDASAVGETLVNMHALERMFDLKNEGAPARGGRGRKGGK